MPAKLEPAESGGTEPDQKKKKKKRQSLRTEQRGKKFYLEVKRLNRVPPHAHH